MEQPIVDRYVKSPCVRCRRIDTDMDYIYATGSSHAECYDYLYYAHDMYVRAWPEKYDAKEGFLCNDNTFVDREEAFDIAKAMDQLKDSYDKIEQGVLQSFMLKGFGLT